VRLTQRIVAAIGRIDFIVQLEFVIFADFAESIVFVV